MSVSIPSPSLFSNPRLEELRVAVRDFADSVVAPRVSEMEESKTVAYEVSRSIAEQGWIGVTVAPRYGGMGLGHTAKTIIIEGLARVSGAMGAMVQASQLGVAKILHFGSEAQKRRWLPAVCEGSCLPTIAVTEREAGSDVLGMGSSAVRVGDEYVLNGSKVFVGNSHIGDLHGVVMRTGGDDRGSKCLSAFLVEKDTPGLRLEPWRPSMGLHGFSFGELVFEDCRVPAENLLGAEGDGLQVAYSSSVLYGRPNLSAVSLGIHRALTERTIAFAREHVRYGEPLSELPTVKQVLGRMQSLLMSAEMAAYHAVGMLDEGRACDAELMHAKLVTYESSIDAARLAMEVHAAHGLEPSRQVERFYRDAPHIYAPAGTADVQRLRLSEVALGTYRGNWSTRLVEQLRESVEALRVA